MKLRFGEIEQILQIVHGVPASGVSPFRAKMRNLSRVGLQLPSGGKGRKANYDPADLFKLAFAMELLQAGASPEPVAISVAQHWPDLVAQLFAARREMRGGKKLASRYLVAEPSALKGLPYRFKAETGKALAARIAHSRNSLLIPRLLIINAAAMLYRIEQAAMRIGLDMKAFNARLDQDQAIVLKHGARV